MSASRGAARRPAPAVPVGLKEIPLPPLAVENPVTCSGDHPSPAEPRTTPGCTGAASMALDVSPDAAPGVMSVRHSSLTKCATPGARRCQVGVRKATRVEPDESSARPRHRRRGSEPAGHLLLVASEPSPASNGSGKLPLNAFGYGTARPAVSETLSASRNMPLGAA